MSIAAPQRTYFCYVPKSLVEILQTFPSLLFSIIYISKYLCPMEHPRLLSIWNFETTIYKEEKQIY